MQGIRISGLKSVDACRIDKGLYLMLFHADKTPPHLAVVYEGLLYSLKASGAEIKDIKAVMRSVRVKMTPCLLIQLLPPEPQSGTQELAEGIFRKFDSFGEGQSCMTPIRELLGTLYAFEPSVIRNLFDLYPLLEKSGRIIGHYSIHLDIGSDDQSFYIKPYDQDAIENRINEVKGTKIS